MSMQYFESKSIGHLIGKTLLFLLGVQIAFICLFYSTDILWDKYQELPVLFGEFLLIVFSIFLGIKIKQKNRVLINENPKKTLLFLVTLAIFLGISYYILFSTSGMMQSVQYIDLYRTHLANQGLVENPFHRTIICFFAQFGVWTPIQISLCFVPIFAIKVMN